MVPEDLRYTEEHEWVRVEDDIVVVGITDYAQSELGDVVFIELPTVGDEIEQAASMGVIEAVKAVSDVYLPVSGEIVEVNDALEKSPELLNREPYGDGWLVKIAISDISELDRLLSPESYSELIGE